MNAEQIIQEVLTRIGKDAPDVRDINEIGRTCEEWHDGKRTAMYKLYKCLWDGTPVPTSWAFYRKLAHEAEATSINLSDALHAKWHPRLRAVHDYALKCQMHIQFAKRVVDVAEGAAYMEMHDSDLTALVLSAYRAEKVKINQPNAA